MSRPVDEREAVFRRAAVERLSMPDELTEMASVIHPQGWLILAAVALLGAAVLAWGFLGAVPITVAGEGRLLTQGGAATSAVLLVPAAAAAEVRPGLPVRLTLTALPPHTAGRVLTGRVARIGVRGRDRSVEVALAPAPAAGRLPEGDLQVSGEIVLRRERPVAGLLPWLDRLLGGAA